MARALETIKFVPRPEAGLWHALESMPRYSGGLLVLLATACGGLFEPTSGSPSSAATGGSTVDPTPAPGGTGNGGTSSMTSWGGTSGGTLPVVQASADATGGSAASSLGALPKPGYFEIDVEAWNDPIGYDCGPLYAGTKLILHWTRIGGCGSESVDCFQARFMLGTLFESSLEIAAQTREKDSLAFVPAPNEQNNGFLAESIARVVLNLGPSGFSGTGRATLQRQCGGRESIRYERGLVLAEDHRGPTMRVRTRPYLMSHVVTWAPLELDADEPVTNSGLFACQSTEGCPSTFNLSWTDSTHAGAVPTLPIRTNYPSVLVSDPATVAGQQLAVVPNLGLEHADLAGNVVREWPSSVRFVDDQPVGARLDFDTEAPRGVVGPSEWVPSEVIATRCESGRCLMLGPLSPCSFPRTPVFHSLRLQNALARALRVRMALETDSPWLKVSPLVIPGLVLATPSTPLGARLAEVTLGALEQSVVFLPRAFPDGVFTHTSGFSTYEIAPNAHEILGAAVTIACGVDNLFAPVTARLLIEWYETAE